MTEAFLPCILIAMKSCAVDLFCGVGGLTHGLIRAGIPVACGIDIDESCRFAYEYNNKGATFIHKKIEEVTPEFLMSMFPQDQIKVLAGCAPCQPFSSHTQKYRKEDNNNSDSRWQLLRRFTYFIGEIRPQIVTLENVGRLLRHRVFHECMDLLKDLGYHTFCKVVNCPDYGIPQSRRRLVVLASQLGELRLPDPKFRPEGYLSVRDIITDLPVLEAGQVDKGDPLHRASGMSELTLRRIRASKEGGTWQDWDPDLRCECHTRESGKTYRSVYGRMEWDKPSPTITTEFFNYGTGRFGHPNQDRAISLREGALLQTFPQHYIFEQPGSLLPTTQIARYIGNAVPVKLGEIVGQAITSHLKDIYAGP